MIRERGYNDFCSNMLFLSRPAEMYTIHVWQEMFSHHLISKDFDPEALSDEHQLKGITSPQQY